MLKFNLNQKRIIFFDKYRFMKTEKITDDSIFEYPQNRTILRRLFFIKIRNEAKTSLKVL